MILLGPSYGSPKAIIAGLRSRAKFRSVDGRIVKITDLESGMVVTLVYKRGSVDYILQPGDFPPPQSK